MIAIRTGWASEVSSRGSLSRRCGLGMDGQKTLSKGSVAMRSMPAQGPSRRRSRARSRSCRPRQGSCRRGSGRPGRTAAPCRRGSGSSAARHRTRSRPPAPAGRRPRGVADRRRLERELDESLRLPGEHLVGHALERLAEHHEADRRPVAGAEVDVGEPAAAAAGAPLDREHHQVEGVHRLHLHPGGAAPAGVVGRGEVLDHHALVAEVEHPETNASALAHVVGHQPGTRCSSGTSPASASSRSEPGESTRSRPSRWSRSKK